MSVTIISRQVNKYISKKYLLSGILIIIILLHLSSCASAGKAYYSADNEQVTDNTTENPINFAVQTGTLDINMLILSDIHGYNTEKLVNDENTYQYYLKNTKKKFDSSLKNTEAVLVAAAEGSKIDIVLLPGDLTINGEKESHLLLAEKLAMFEKSGKKVFVVPGNHDVRGTKGRQFLHNKSKYAKNVSAEEFASIYSEFGYKEAFDRDESSLSYAVEPVPGFVLLCLDTAKWEYNTYFPFRGMPAEGQITNTTRLWIRSILSGAQRNGKTVIIMQHHPLWESGYPEKKMLSDSENVRKFYEKYGAALVISGHRHKYTINFTDPVPQVMAPSISTGSTNAVQAEISDGTVFITLDPFNFGE